MPVSVSFSMLLKKNHIPPPSERDLCRSVCELSQNLKDASSYVLSFVAELQQQQERSSVRDRPRQ